MRFGVRAGLALLVMAGASLHAAPERETKTADPRGARPVATPPQSFDALWVSARKLPVGAAGHQTLGEIERLRVERNVTRLESVARALVGRCLERLGQNELEGAEQDARHAMVIDPALADGYFALARVQQAGGPLGYLAALETRAEGFFAFAGTARGRRHLLLLALPVAVLTLLAVVTAWSATLLAKHGALLRHDLDEWLGPRRAGSLGLGLLAGALALPVLAFQGYGWLPLWWLALLFVHMSQVEKIVTALMVAALVGVGPGAERLERGAQLAQTPLFLAMESALVGGPDERALAQLRKASTQSPDDRDLGYLIALLERKAGRVDEAGNTYRAILGQRPGDAVATNNLANLDFVAREFGAAIARYRQVGEVAQQGPVGATARYNLSLAYLQRFERQQAEEARSQAERLGADLVRSYEARWQFRNGEYAVVDLGPTVDEIAAKFVAPGAMGKNLAGQPAAAARSLLSLSSLFNRFSAAALAFAVLVVLHARTRGARMFTLRCLKCGTPFCRRCHLGNVVGGLCTQCHHLFMVRDGVSGPARNQKLLEVQGEEERRDRVFRALALFSPGAGQVYGQRHLVGLSLSCLWYGVLVTMVMAGRVFPITEVPSQLGGYGGMALAVALLAATYAAGLSLKPEAVISAAFSRQRRTRG